MRSTNKATAALKATYQTPVYPLLDAVRCELGSKIDIELAHLKVCTDDLCSMTMDHCHAHSQQIEFCFMTHANIKMGADPRLLSYTVSNAGSLAFTIVGVIVHVHCLPTIQHGQLLKHCCP